MFTNGYKKKITLIISCFPDEGQPWNPTAGVLVYSNSDFKQDREIYCTWYDLDGNFWILHQFCLTIQHATSLHIFYNEIRNAERHFLSKRLQAKSTLCAEAPKLGRFGSSKFVNLLFLNEFVYSISFRSTLIKSYFLRTLGKEKNEMFFKCCDYWTTDLFRYSYVTLYSDRKDKGLACEEKINSQTSNIQTIIFITCHVTGWGDRTGLCFHRSIFPSFRVPRDIITWCQLGERTMKHRMQEVHQC